ncbi:MAG: hypothetical protein AAF985_16595, partial [Bacteroidota bacterium]
IGQKFLNKGERKEGIRLIKQAYHLAVDYNFVHLACELSSILYYDHIYYNKNKSKAAFYAQQVDLYLNDYTAEKKAEHQLFIVISKMNRSAQPHYIATAIEQLSNYRGRSIKYKIYEATLNVLYGLNVGDYQRVVNSSQMALTFFEHKSGVYETHYFSFQFYAGVGQLALSQYSGAFHYFQQAEQYTLKKSYNAHLLALYQTITCLHGGEYSRAYQLYRKNKNCKIEQIKVQFAIIEAYLCFLAYVGLLSFDKPFRLGKYLNDTFKAQADKQGDNINILIAELLIYLARDRGKFIDRIEAIQNYSYRHLKAKATKRAKRFIQILCTLPRVNFNPMALQRKANRPIRYLKDHPIFMGDHVMIEIIPFESLLDMLIQYLKRKAA